ncbi:hypothetical protein QJQ45_029775 [Haematococcus lacustris]|nr:hypothetical protein QJQ45_029775 [Haematococcus lacustris]
MERFVVHGISADDAAENLLPMPTAKPSTKPAAATADGPPIRKRGRPSGSKNKPKPAPTAQFTPTPTRKRARLVCNTSNSANSSSASNSSGNNEGNRGDIFNSDNWREICKLLGMRTAMSTAYHPESDGQTERVNIVVAEMLRASISPAQSDWSKHLEMVPTHTHMFQRMA